MYPHPYFLPLTLSIASSAEAGVVCGKERATRSAQAWEPHIRSSSVRSSVGAMLLRRESPSCLICCWG